MDTQYGSEDCQQGEPGCVKIGQHWYGSLEQTFCITRSKISTPLITDYVTYEWAVVIGDPNKEKFREHTIDMAEADLIIKRHKMKKVYHSKDGDIWEMSGSPYHEAYKGTFQRLRDYIEYSKILRKMAREDRAKILKILQGNGNNK